MRELAGVSRLGISPWSRDIRRTLTGVSKVNVWAMSSLRGLKLTFNYLGLQGSNLWRGLANTNGENCRTLFY